MQKKKSKSRGTLETREMMRRRTVAAIKRGRTVKEMAETFGVSYSAVRNWNKKHKGGGSKALLSARHL